MTTIFHEADADLAALEGQAIAVVGYGNQGRSWALNLRDSGVDVQVCVRADESRTEAEADGFTGRDLEAANEADVVCVLIPDDAIPGLPVTPREDALTVLATGYVVAFDRWDPPGDIGMVAPRMLGPEVRRSYDEGVGFITGVGVHRDVTGTAQARTLAVAKAIGGLKQGGIEMTPTQEALLDLAVEQVLAPALQHVQTAFVEVMLEQGISLEAIITEQVLSGEVERTMRLVRLEGYAAQMEYHSPTSQYGQLSRKDEYSEFDVAAKMRQLTEYIASGKFADEWDDERDAGHPRLEELKERWVGSAIRELEADLRRRLGETAVTD